MDKLKVLCGNSGFIFNPASGLWHLSPDGKKTSCAVSLTTEQVVEQFIRYNIDRLSDEYVNPRDVQYRPMRKKNPYYENELDEERA